MKRLGIPVLVALWTASASALAGSEQPVLVVATEKGSQTCLSDGELRDEVAAKRAIPQAAALKTARAAVQAEPVRARLCRREAGLVYVITALAKDGKVTRVTLDAETGRVIGQR